MIEIVDDLEEKSTVVAGIAKGSRKRVLAQLPIIILREFELSIRSIRFLAYLPASVDHKCFREAP
jgi:hypothetical protein